MLKQYEHLPGWTFKAREVSNGVWRVSAVHESGPSVETSDTDMESAIRWCQSAAKELHEKMLQQNVLNEQKATKTARARGAQVAAVTLIVLMLLIALGILATLPYLEPADRWERLGDIAPPLIGASGFWMVLLNPGTFKGLSVQYARRTVRRSLPAMALSVIGLGCLVASWVMSS
jgi:hypothetical protein